MTDDEFRELQEHVHNLTVSMTSATATLADLDVMAKGQEARINNLAHSFNVFVDAVTRLQSRVDGLEAKTEAVEA